MKHTRSLGPLTVRSPLYAALLLLTASVVRAENHPPVAEDFQIGMWQSQVVHEDASLHAYDPDGDPIFIVVGKAAHGRAWAVPAWEIWYEPDSSFSEQDSFRYTAVDVYGAQASGTATVYFYPYCIHGYGINPQPGNGIAGLPLSRAPELKGKDEAGNPVITVTQLLSPVLVSLVPGTGTPGAVLLGRAQRALEVFRWDDIGVDRPGEGYVLNMMVMIHPDYPVSLTSTPFTIYPASTVPLYQATKPITIDGTLSPEEWPGGPALQFGEAAQDVIPGMWTGPADYSGTLRLEWSADALYLAMRVTDDVLSFPETDPAAIWLRDGVEVFLGLKQPQNPARTAYDAPGDYQVILSADANADGTFSGRWYSPQAADRIQGPTENVKLVRTPVGYLMEAAIPWTLLTGSTPPVQGQYLGFNVMVKDNDRVPPNEDSAFSFSRLGESSTDPSHWTAALLMGAPLYTLPDVLRALRIAGGLAPAMSRDIPFLDVVPSHSVNMRDAVHMIRKVMYLDPRL